MSIERTTLPSQSPQLVPGGAADAKPSLVRQQQQHPQGQQQQASVKVSQQALPHGPPPQQQQGGSSAGNPELRDSVQDTQDNDANEDDNDETDMEGFEPLSGEDDQTSDPRLYDEAARMEADLRRANAMAWSRPADLQEAAQEDIDAVDVADDLDDIGENDDEEEEDEEDNEDDDEDDQDELEGDQGNDDDEVLGQDLLQQGTRTNIGQEGPGAGTGNGAAAVKRVLSSTTAGSLKPAAKKGSSWKAKRMASPERWDSIGLASERDSALAFEPDDSTWEEDPLPSDDQTWGDDRADYDQGWGEAGHDHTWEDEVSHIDASWGDATGNDTSDTSAWNGSAPSSPTPLPPLSPSAAPSTPLLAQRCDTITRLLRQGQFQQGITLAAMAVNQAIARRKGDLDDQSSEHFTAEELQLMENAYCALWTKTVLDKRNGIHAMAPFLSNVIQLAVLKVEQDRVIPEPYAQTVQALFHQGDFDSYRRTRRASRMSGYDDPVTGYGYEDHELARVQRDFQAVFQELGGMEACLTAMEMQLEEEDKWDIKLRQLLALLTLCSKIRLQGDAQRSRTAVAAEYSSRLTSIVLKYFPDQVDVLNTVDKAIVFDVVGQVSDFMLENHRARSRSYEDSEEEDDDDDMSGPPGYQQHLHSHHHRRHSASEIRAQIKVADFRLEMAARMLKCSRLDMRLAGLSEIKEVLAPVLNRMQQHQQQPRTSRVRRRSDGGDSYGSLELDKKSVENMCARLHDLQIVGYIFGPNIHLEIVQRSAEVLTFMLQTHALPLTDLDIIWAASGGNQHRSIVYGVYQVLSDLSNELPLEYVLHLFQHLQAAPLEQWDQQLVDLTRSLFQAVLRETHPSKDDQRGLLVPYLTLFNVLRRSVAQQRSKEDPVFSAAQPIANAVVLSISNLLSEGLRLSLSVKDCRSLMDICVNDLKTHHPGSVWSLQVIQALFDHQFQTEEGLAFMTKVSPTLPDLFVADFQAFAESMKAQASSVSPTTASFSSVSNYAYTQEQQRMMQLKTRLDFLESMSKKMPAVWASTAIADKLWESLIVEPINAHDRELAFRCLESINDHAFIMYIFEQLLPRLDVRDFTEAAWSCIQQYFLQLNWNLKNLLADVDQTTGLHSYIVVQPLVGLDSIWGIALGARLPRVGQLATDLLNTLIKRPEAKPGLPEGLASFQEGLVRTCLEHLFETADGLGALSKDQNVDNTDLPLKFERCINVLKAFLATYSAQARDQGEWPRIHGALDEDSMLKLKVSGASSSPMLTLSIHPSETVLNLKRQIVQRLNAPSVDGIRLFTMGRDISPQVNNKTLEDMRVMNGQHFIAQILRQQSISMDTSEDSVVPSPTDLLLQEEVYSRILQCLHLDERFASQAWEIVVCLPTSPRLLQDLVELNEPIDWASFLEARSPFMLLYSLQIINALVRKDLEEEDSPQSQDGSGWTARFIERGGLTSLTSVIMSDSGLGMAKRTGQTEKKTLGLMLKVLVRLFSQTVADLSQVSPDINGSELLKKLVQEILNSASLEGGLEREDQAIVLNATSLVSSLCSGPEGWHHFKQLEDVTALLRVALVQSYSPEIRQAFVDMCSQFCSQRNMSMSDETDPRIFFLGILASFLPIPMEYASHCGELFEFFGSIVKDAAGITTSEYYQSLYSDIIDLLLNHHSIEDRPDKEDTVLIGLLKVATVMLDAEKTLKSQDITAKVVDYVFDECLFPQDLSSTSTAETRIAKCQSSTSRTAALAFLETCATGSVNTLQHIMAKLHRQSHRTSDDPLASEWAYNPKDNMRASCGFVGLQNLGATCYMNSLLQQFFMNRTFRKGLLEAPTGVAPGEENFESLLYQLQVLMGNLQESRRRSFNAFGFCYSYKDWDGNPTNVAIQMDVDEFFSILFDRLESQLKDTSQEQLLKNVYGGKLVQQIKSKDCEHISEREDSFFSVQCEVKNKRSVEESLELYVQGEILDGDNKYKCSGCDKHVDAIKRACIKELPQNLVLHLKRFDYDMDTMSRIKINDRFEFPTVLDMEPYTLDYLTRKEQAQEGGAPATPRDGNATEPSKYEYNLVGVLVHTGTADSGHYYSYIKDRSRKRTSTSDRGSWLHFNDSTVEEFDPSDIPAKAFGGTDFLPSESPYHKSPGRSVAKCYSAYMLFYERAYPATMDTDDDEEDIESTVPQGILEGVRLANSRLLKDVAIFDPHYYKFVWDLFHMHQPAPTSDFGYGGGESLSKAVGEFAQSLAPMDRLHLERLSLRYGIDFFFSVLIHARDIDQELKQWTTFLADLMEHDPQGCIEMLQMLSNDTELLSNALISCKVTNVRQAVVQLVLACLHHLRRNEPVHYGLREVKSSSVTPATTVDDTESMMETRLVCEEGTPIFRFTEALGELLNDARVNWQQFDEYFSLLHNITLLGKEERAMMVQQGHLTKLIEFFISDERHDSKKKKMMDKFSKPSFHYVLLTIQELLLTCDVVRSMERITSASTKASHHRRSSTTSNRSTSSSGGPSPSSQASPEDSGNLSDIDTGLSDGAVTFSITDLHAMIYTSPVNSSMGKDRAPVFFAKMIQDRTETEIVATIARYLSVYPPLGDRVLDYVSVCLDHMNDDHVQTVLQVFKELIQIDDDHTEARSDVILQRTIKALSLSPSPTIAYDCLEFLRAISDFGQCGRYVQRWLLANKSAWLQEMLIVNIDQDTRVQTQQFVRDLLSSERAFNATWTDAQVVEATSRHFQELLECMRMIPSFVPYYQQQQRSPSADDDDGMYRFVEYFQLLAEMVVSDVERTVFNQYWGLFFECLHLIDARHITLDYDKKEMMILWSKLMNDDQNRTLGLSRFKQVGQLLRHYYVCLQPNQANLSFHWETLPIYFDLVFRFCQVSAPFHIEWAQSHNYRWAIGAMIWGTFKDHCPEVLHQLLKYTLIEFPVYREECWKTLPAPTTQNFSSTFIQLSRAMFAPNNEMCGQLFYRNNGLIWLTNVMKMADNAGNVLDPKDFYAVDALDVLHDYLTKIPECLNQPYFAEAFDHWQNLDEAIQLLSGNLMWNISYDVYKKSIDILRLIVRMGSPTQSAPVVAALDKAHVEWRNMYDAEQYGKSRIYEIFGGSLSPFFQSGVLHGPAFMPGVNFPPVRLGASIFVPTDLVLQKTKPSGGLDPVFEQWYEPYWALAKEACKLDGTKELNSKSIELAALVLIEQISVGCSSLLSVLCEAAQLSKTDSDMLLALQNPYVTLLMERLLECQKDEDEEEADHHPFLWGIGEQLLTQCDDLVRATIDNLDRDVLVKVTKRMLDQGQHTLEMIVQGAEQNKDDDDEDEEQQKQKRLQEEAENDALMEEDVAGAAKTSAATSTKKDRGAAPVVVDNNTLDKDSQQLTKALQLLRLLSGASMAVMDDSMVDRWNQLVLSVLSSLQYVSDMYRPLVVQVLNSSKLTPSSSARPSTSEDARRAREEMKNDENKVDMRCREDDDDTLDFSVVATKPNIETNGRAGDMALNAVEITKLSEEADNDIKNNKSVASAGPSEGGASPGSNSDNDQDDRSRMMSLEKDDA